MPLVRDGSVVAVISLYGSAADAFTDDHARLLTLLAPSLATSIAAVPKSALRGLLRFGELGEGLPLDEVEPASEIVKRLHDTGTPATMSRATPSTGARSGFEPRSTPHSMACAD